MPRLEHLDETVPLLHNRELSAQTRQQEQWWRSVPFRFHRVPIRISLPILSYLIMFFNEAEFFIKQPAQVRAVEAMACLEHYSHKNDPLARHGRNIPELMCKSNEIQERVAALTGVIYFVRMASAVLGTLIILYWFKAGRRRPVLILHKANMLVSNLLLIIAYYGYPALPIWFVCLNGATGIFGGNSDLAISVIFAAYADAIPDATRRSNLIFITVSLQYFAQFVCLPITNRLMSLHGKGTTPEVSFFVAIGCSLTALCLCVFFYPETFNQEQKTVESEDANAVPGGDDVKDNTSSAGHSAQGLENGDGRQDNMSQPHQPESSTHGPYQVLREEFGFFRVACLLLAMLCSTASVRLVDYFAVLQYPSVKFRWTLSDTTWLICMQAILSFITFVIVLPAVNKFCQHKFQISARSTSVGIIIASSVIVAACSIVLGLPGTTAITFIVFTGLYTLGSGVSSAVQTYTVSVAKSPRSSGAALTVLSLAAIGGKVAASAIWPAALTIGLEHPSGKLGGLPFFVVAAFAVFVIAVIGLADWTKEGKNKSAG